MWLRQASQFANHSQLRIIMFRANFLAFRPLLALLAACSAILLPACGQQQATDDEPLVIYSSRNEQLIKPLLDQYSRDTGQAIELITGKEGPMLQRLRAEGAQSPADMLITVDAGNLWKAADDDLLRPLDDAELLGNIPAHLRDPQGRWFGLSVRARTIAYSTERVQPNDLSTYAALGEQQWKDRVCLRTSKKVYNQSLVAMMIAAEGKDAAQATVEAWVANLATDPFANDTAVLEAIAAGQCDVGIVNTYYFGRLQKQDPDFPVALFWPNQDSALGDNRGVHVNVSGAGITQAADQADAALALLRWLAGAQAQGRFAGDNLEFPANPAVEPVPQVQAWGSFAPSLINVSTAGRLQADAVKLMERAGYR